MILSSMEWLIFSGESITFQPWNNISTSYFPVSSVTKRNFQNSDIALNSQITIKARIIFLIYVAQLVKNPLAMQETPVRFLGREDPLEKG